MANQIDERIKDEYSSIGSVVGGGLIEKLAKFKNFNNRKTKNYWIYARIQLLNPDSQLMLSDQQNSEIL